MLGKGLGSLIPQRKGDGSSSVQNSQSSQMQAQHQTPQQSGQTTHEPHQHPKIDLSGEHQKNSDVKQSTLPLRKERIEEVKHPHDDAIFHIELDKITSNPHQPRHNFDEEALKELAVSIREYGVLQPILVSKIEKESDSGRTVEYELIAGERRLMASKLSGLRTIPAIIRRLTPEREKLEIAIIENIQRRDLDAIEEAKAYTRLQDEFRLTQREIAAKLGKSREVIANSVRLLNLPTDVQMALSQRKISESQARLLLSIEDIGEQQKMFEEILKGGMSVRAIRSKIQKKKDMSSGKLDFVRPEILALKEKLEEILGTKVDLKEEGDKGGKITINFYSKEDLNSLVAKIAGEGSSLTSRPGDSQSL